MIEYALIIALVSIALVVALQGLVSGAGNPFPPLVTRVMNCLKTGGTCA